MKSHTVGIYYFGMTADSSKVKSTFAFLNEVLHLAPATIKLDDLIRFHIHQFNIDTACVELVFDDRIQISIDFTAVENEVADNRFQRSELDYLIYNDPLAYADLILNSKLNVLFE